jgi:hypothetical protein
MMMRVLKKRVKKYGEGNGKTNIEAISENNRH